MPGDDLTHVGLVWSLEAPSGTSVVCELYEHPRLGFRLEVGPVGSVDFRKWARSWVDVQAAAHELLALYPELLPS